MTSREDVLKTQARVKTLGDQQWAAIRDCKEELRIIYEAGFHPDNREEHLCWFCVGLVLAELYQREGEAILDSVDNEEGKDNDK